MEFFLYNFSSLISNFVERLNKLLICPLKQILCKSLISLISLQWNYKGTHFYLIRKTRIKPRKFQDQLALSASLPSQCRISKTCTEKSQVYIYIGFIMQSQVKVDAWVINFTSLSAIIDYFSLYQFGFVVRRRKIIENQVLYSQLVA